MNRISENKHSSYGTKIIWYTSFCVLLVFILLSDVSKAQFESQDQTIGGVIDSLSVCGADNTWNWKVSDNSYSYIDQAWIGTHRDWDDVGTTGEDFSGFFRNLYRTDKPGCGLLIGECGSARCCWASNCAGSIDIAGGTIWVRAGQPEVNLNFWVQGVNLVTSTPFGAHVNYGYARIICNAGQRVDSGVCVPITGSVTLNKTSCIAPCDVDLTWNTNSYQVATITKNSVDLTSVTTIDGVTATDASGGPISD